MNDFEKGMCKKLNELEDIKCVVVSKRGFCACGYHECQEFIIKRQKTCEGICVSAFHSMLTQYFGFVFGATFPWDYGQKLYLHRLSRPGEYCYFQT